MAQSLLLLILGGSLCVLACMQGWGMWLIGWLGLDFAVLGVAHLLGLHGLFGKRRDGTLPWWSWAIFLPLHLYSLAVLKMARSIGNEPWICTVNERLSVGSRPTASDDCAIFDVVVDLTAEFQEVKQVRQRAAYFCFPILDASAPDADALQAALRIGQEGRVLIHCAQGHGRTGLFAAAWLLANGDAATADEALRMLTDARPRIRLNSGQRRCLADVEKRLKI